MVFPTERITKTVPTTRPGYVGDKWRITRPIKNLKNTPAQFSTPYNIVKAYILADIPPDDDSNLTTAQNEHQDKCDAMRTLFDDVIDCDEVHSLTFNTGTNSWAQFRGVNANRQLQNYFIAELQKMGDGEMMCIYMHATGRGNGQAYEWMTAMSPRGGIDAYALFQNIIDQEKDVLILLDGPMPTRFGKKLEAPHSAFEIIHTSGPALDKQGGEYKYELTEALRTCLPLVADGTRILPWRKSFPEILAKDKELWNNPQRQWTNKTTRNSHERVVRFCVEPTDLLLYHKIRIHGCEIQGPWCPVHGDAPSDDDSGHESGNDGDDDDGGNVAVGAPSPKRRRGRKTKKAKDARSKAKAAAKTTTKTTGAGKTSGKTTKTAGNNGRRRRGRGNKSATTSSTLVNDLPLLNLCDSSVPPDSDDEALITPKEEEEPYYYLKREESVILLFDSDDEENVKMESDVEVVSGVPRGGNMLFVSDEEDNDDEVEFVSLHRDVVNIIDSDED